MAKKVGFLVNPIAGMGGAVGLKGTDGALDEAIRRGAAPKAATRAGRALSLLAGEDIDWCTCSGAMGQATLDAAGITRYTVLHRAPDASTAEDTRRACRAFSGAGVELIVFCGGDGTARDVFDAVGSTLPILGIPAGVKMYSAVFAVNPAAAADLIRNGAELRCRDSEVLDVDEGAYRRGSLATRLYGFARVPYLPERTQGSKQVFEHHDEERAKEDIARFIAEIMMPDTLYIFGAGSTTAHIVGHLGLAKTLLGVDAVRNGRLVARDADEQTLCALIDPEERVKIVVSPIGAQGFVLGRGNQQISPAVVRRAGVGSVIVVATPQKLAGTPALYVDSGDPELDGEFGDSIAVVSGYRIAQRKRLLHPGSGSHLER
ncbi:MAG: ATP-NAD kinase family protein [Methanomicrobiaceae archaeon]|nr:ATP-NAD kinase family protein [Methanomicrobiaceae archaeon]MDD5419523.1 ATP-NAD kinase family protein [Methanomicrobiaceae archaeon]